MNSTVHCHFSLQALRTSVRPGNCFKSVRYAAVHVNSLHLCFFDTMCCFHCHSSNNLHGALVDKQSQQFEPLLNIYFTLGLLKNSRPQCVFLFFYCANQCKSSLIRHTVYIFERQHFIPFRPGRFSFELELEPLFYSYIEKQQIYKLALRACISAIFDKW